MATSCSAIRCTHTLFAHSRGCFENLQGGVLRIDF